MSILKNMSEKKITFKKFLKQLFCNHWRTESKHFLERNCIVSETKCSKCEKRIIPIYPTYNFSYSYSYQIKLLERSKALKGGERIEL